MSARLIIHRIGPGATVQDMGRLGFIALGLSRGGAMDRMALHEGAVLLEQSAELAAIELPGMGGLFEVTRDSRIALTGAAMRATLDGASLVWNASHVLPAGARLDIGPATEGAYGYLSIGGGIDAPVVMRARSAHLTAGIGRPLAAGDILPLGADPGAQTGVILPRDDRFDGGTLRVVPSLQTALFPNEQTTRFATTAFARDPRANRMGIRLASEGPGFGVEGGLNVVSEIIVPGDIQITGDGAPYILMAECQTTGGYPRLATVIPADLPRAAQAQAGALLRFAWITRDEAVEIERRSRADIAALPRRIRPLVRDPARVPDLLTQTLISGVTAGDDLERMPT